MTATDQPQNRRYLCDITCGEQCRRCEDPNDHRKGWTSPWDNPALRAQVENIVDAVLDADVPNRRN
jgi:hypothetical protein